MRNPKEIKTNFHRMYAVTVVYFLQLTFLISKFLMPIFFCVWQLLIDVSIILLRSEIYWGSDSSSVFICFSFGYLKKDIWIIPLHYVL